MWSRYTELHIHLQGICSLKLSMLGLGLMQASKARDGAICTLLLEKGASPRAKDSTGSVPPHRHDPPALAPLASLRMSQKAFMRALPRLFDWDFRCYRALSGASPLSPQSGACIDL